LSECDLDRSHLGVVSGLFGQSGRYRLPQIFPRVNLTIIGAVAVVESPEVTVDADNGGSISVSASCIGIRFFNNPCSGVTALLPWPMSNQMIIRSNAKAACPRWSIVTIKGASVRTGYGD